MAATIYSILNRLIGDRDVSEMKCSEARQLVSEFYLEVECATVGTANKYKVDSIATAALRNAGLGFFA